MWSDEVVHLVCIFRACQVYVSGGIPITPQWKEYSVRNSTTWLVEQNTNTVMGAVPVPGKIVVYGKVNTWQDCEMACQQVCMAPRGRVRVCCQVRLILHRVPSLVCLSVSQSVFVSLSCLRSLHTYVDPSPCHTRAHTLSLFVPP